MDFVLHHLILRVELLKAYRRAHARNSLIEPFEARLRETTPLTSISDPAAFVEYVSQLSTKGDMVMGELKKVSGEKDSLKIKLEEAERQAKTAYDEVTKLREQPVANSHIDTEASEKTNDSLTEGTPSASSPRGLSMPKTIFSPRQKPTQTKEQTASEMFSVEDEVSKLQAELQERNGEIQQLQSQSELLKGELTTARESAEHMMRDLEKTQQALESAQSTATLAEEESNKRLKELQGHVASLEEQVKDTQAKLDLAKQHFDGRAEEITRLHKDKAELQDQLEGARGRTIAKSASEEAGNAASEKHAEVEDPSAKKKKNKKRKKKGNAAQPAAEQGNEKSVADTDGPNQHAEADNTSSTSDAVVRLKDKDDTIDRLHSRLKSQGDLMEEIESLRDELLNLGQEHVEAKDKIKELEAQKLGLNHKITQLEEQARTALSDHTQSVGSLEREKATLASRAHELETEIRTLTEAAHATSASSEMQDQLSKAFESLKLQ